MNDYIVRGTAASDSIRFFAMSSDSIVEKAMEAHRTSNVMSAALGRLLTAGALMGAMQKNDTDVLTIQVNCGGPAGGLTVTSAMGSDGSVCVKGYPVNPDVDIPLKPNGKLDVSGALGPGILTVIKDMGLKEPFSGQTELVSGEIAEDLTYYFANSEQVPSSVALGVLVEPEGRLICAGGFIIQLMPFAPDEVIDELEKRLGGLEPVTTMLLKGMTAEAIMEEIFRDFDLRITDRVPARFYCDCSKDRVRKAILSINASDIREMIDDGKPIEVNCHFCGKHYNFDVDELKQILDEKKESGNIISNKEC